MNFTAVLFIAVILLLLGMTDTTPESRQDSYSLQPLVKEVIIDAPREEVWNAWTTSKGITTFFGAAANIKLTLGGSFEIYFDLAAESGFRGSEGCTVLSYVDQELLSFTWNAPPKFMAVRGDRTFVVLNFSDAEDGKTNVKLTHGGWKEGDEWAEVHAYFDNAWDFVLQSLVSRFTESYEIEEGQVLNESGPCECKHYVYFIRPTREDFLSDPSSITTKEREAFTGHVEYVSRLYASGRLILAGPCLEPAYYPDGKEAVNFDFPLPGIVVFEAVDDAEAKKVMQDDPAVQAGVFKGRVSTFNLAYLRK